MGDLDGNGTADLAGISSAGNIYYSTNLSTWTRIPGTLARLAVGDLNGDGRDDLAGVSSAGNIYWYQPQHLDPHPGLVVRSDQDQRHQWRWER